MKKQLWGFIALLVFASAETNYVDQAMDALKEITTEQIEEIEQTANNTNSKNTKNIKGFVLSTQIKSFSDISSSTDMEIEKMKEDVRLLIRQVALDIEMHKGEKSGALSLDKYGNVHYQEDPSLAESINKKRKQFLEANLKNNVSMRSAYIALSLLGNINNEIIEQAKAAKNRKVKEKLYMKQAIFVYEISDIVLELLNKLTLDGKNSIEKMHQEAKAEVDKTLRDIEEQKKEARQLFKDGEITAKALDKELDDSMKLSNANIQSLDKWKDILDKIGSQDEFIKKVKAKKKIIRYKQNKAKNQINTLRGIKKSQSIEESIGMIDNLIGTVEDLDLLVLNEEVVNELLGNGDIDE
jgi:hypothetical protein